MAKGSTGGILSAMSMMRFGNFFPELAAKETRTIIVRQPFMDGHRVELPADEYGLDEMYCVDPACDCRRVMFNVLARYAEAHVATIGYSFEPPSRDAWVTEQTYLDPILPQSEWSESLLALIEDQVLIDEDYVRRLHRHYRMVKDAVADPSHPCQSFLKAGRGSKWGGGGTRKPPLNLGKGPIPPPPRRGKRKWR